MGSNTDFTKLIKLIEAKQFKGALDEIKALETSDLSLKFIEIYCLIEAKKTRSLKNKLKDLLEQDPENELLLKVDLFLESQSDENPLNEFVAAFMNFNKTELSKMNAPQLDKLLHQIIVKPTIK